MKTPSQIITRLSRTSRWLGATLAITLAMLQCSHAAMLHHWDFNTDGTDSISASNVTLVGAATISGGALNIPGGATFVDYGSVNLAATLANNPTLTVECWYTQNALTAWSKVWMFGFDTGASEPALSYIDYTPYTGLGGNPPKIDFDPNDNPELNAPGSAALSAGQQYHAVTIYDAGQNRMSMWINGVLIATNTMGGETIQSLGFNTGRFGSGFFYADQELNGAINDVRIYNNPLGALQIAVNFAAGPDAVVSSYVPSAVHLNAGSTTLLGGQTEPVDVTADFGTLLGVQVTVAATNWISSNPAAVTVNQSGLITAVGAGNANISATVAGVTGSIGISVSAVQPSIAQDLQPLNVFVGSSVGLTVGAQGGNLGYFWFKNNNLVPSQTTATFSFPAVTLSDAGNYSVTVSNQVGTANSSTVSVSVAQQTLDHRYGMDDANVTDSIGGANGSPINNITFSGGRANFPGTLPSGPAGDYIALPGGLVSSYSSVTFEIWATIQPNGNWNQICAFGDQSGTAGNTYLALIPHSGPGDYRMTIRTLSNERATSGATPVDTGTPVHLVGVYSADTGTEVLFANGRQVSSRSTTIDLANLNNLNSWLGRSLFDGDAALKGSIDEFRVWNGPLTPLQIAVNDGLGPNSVNTNPGSFLGLTSISVANTTMVGGTSQQGTALANFSNIPNVPFNSQVTNWVSSNTNVVTVNASGLISAVGSGSSTVSATALGSTANVTISVLAVQPTIVQQPASVTRFTGGGVIFNVVANGGQLQYQWSKGGSPLTGQTNTTLILDNLGPSDVADYRVLISNPAGSTNSALAHLTVTSTLPGGYAGLVLADAPAAYWRLDEATGAVAADSFGTNYATYSGSVTLGVPGVLFNDSDTAIHVVGGGKAEAAYSSKLNNPAGPFSVELWVRPSDTVSSAVISSQNRVGAGRSGYCIFRNMSGNFWQARLGNTNGITLDLLGTSPIVVSNWYHVALTYDGATCSLFVNGKMEASGAITIPTFLPNPAAVLDIGLQNGNLIPNNGDIDETAVYSYALSASKVANHYSAGLYAFTTPPLITKDITDAINYAGSAGQTFAVGVGGSLPLAYTWKHNGSTIPGATTATLTILNPTVSDGGTYQLFVTNANGFTNSALVTLTMNPTALAHRWTFNGDPNDSVGGANATLNGTASIVGNLLQLPGGGPFGNYASVDISPTLQNNRSVTVETWFTLNALPNWSKLWMFGDGSVGEPGLSYLGFTPRTGLGGSPPKTDFDPSDVGEFNTTGGANPAALVTGTNYHVVAVYDAGANSQRFYINGLIADNGTMGGESVQQLTYATMRFGSGFFYADPDINGTIDEMRVYSGVLSAGDAVNDYVAGPNTLVTPGSPVAPVTIHISLSGSSVTLTWGAGVLQQADNVTGPWTIVNGATSGYTVSTAAAARKFYRVRVE